MNDKDKVISGLEHCSEDGCQGCPYEKDCKMADGFSDLAKDALELINYQDQHIEAFLRDQEPKPVKFSENAYGYKTYYCPKCGRWFEFQLKKAKYCDQCGQAVKWDD